MSGFPGVVSAFSDGDGQSGRPAGEGSAQAAPVAQAVLLFGPPGSGKGTQAGLLRARFGFPHISTGELLRQRTHGDDELAAQLRAWLSAGALVPDECVREMLEHAIGEAGNPGGYILDGFPRTVAQAGWLLDRLQVWGHQVLVVHLKVVYNEVIARLAGRRQCVACGRVYHLVLNPPQKAGLCDLDGAGLVSRADDRESVVQARLEAYERQTRPVLDFFEAARVPVHEVDGSHGSPEEIHAAIVARVGWK